MKRRGILAVALLWLATVAGVSTLTWSVISAAGLRVGTTVVVATPVPSGSPGATPGGGSQSWTGTGGRVTVRCTGDSIALGTAVPDVGFSVEVKDKGPDRLRLEFEASGSGLEVETELVAVCQDGTAEFRRE